MRKEAGSAEIMAKNEKICYKIVSIFLYFCLYILNVKIEKESHEIKKIFDKSGSIIKQKEVSNPTQNISQREIYFYTQLSNQNTGNALYL